ncbi:MAG: hypothetical protein KGS61_21390 [Verrucomicrobia bacterium]|nr:hypothetical protein [Verrucomicrobiota bacterium]
MSRQAYPFATQFITDRRGRISKVVLSSREYRALLEALEDAGLHRAMRQVAREKPLRRRAALALLARE